MRSADGQVLVRHGGGEPGHGGGVEAKAGGDGKKFFHTHLGVDGAGHAWESGGAAVFGEWVGNGFVFQRGCSCHNEDYAIMFRVVAE